MFQYPSHYQFFLATNVPPFTSLCLYLQHASFVVSFIQAEMEDPMFQLFAPPGTHILVKLYDLFSPNTAHAILLLILLLMRFPPAGIATQNMSSVKFHLSRLIPNAVFFIKPFLSYTTRCVFSLFPPQSVSRQNTDKRQFINRWSFQQLFMNTVHYISNIFVSHVLIIFCLLLPQIYFSIYLKIFVGQSMCQALCI